MNAIDKIKKLSFRLPDELSGLDGKNRAVMLDDVIDILEESANNGWIPCSEILPEKPTTSLEKGYIVQSKNVIEPYSAFWNGEKWTDFLDDEITNIIAWQPLPEPYKEMNSNEV